MWVTQILGGCSIPCNLTIRHTQFGQFLICKSLVLESITLSLASTHMCAMHYKFVKDKMLLNVNQGCAVVFMQVREHVSVLML